jgi:hypothetical protein
MTYYLDHKEYISEYNKKYYLAHKKEPTVEKKIKMKEYNIIYRETHKEEHAEYLLRNREKLLTNMSNNQKERRKVYALNKQQEKIKRINKLTVEYNDKGEILLSLI